METVLWNQDEQMVEIIAGSTHLLLHPNLEFEAAWSTARRIVTDRGYRMPSMLHLAIIHRLKDSINGLILAHNGATIKDSWYWSREKVDLSHAMYYDMADDFIGYDLQRYTNYVRAIREL